MGGTEEGVVGRGLGVGVGRGLFPSVVAIVTQTSTEAEEREFRRLLGAEARRPR